MERVVSLAETLIGLFGMDRWMFPIAQDDTRVFYQWMRLEQLDQWHHWFILALCVVLLISWIVYWYRKDWDELPRSLGTALLTLRIAAMIGILIFFLDLQKRSEQRMTRPSKVAILVDTSLSMTMPLEDPSIGDIGNSSARITAVQRLFADSSLLDDFRSKHDTTVYRFDQNSRPTAIASFAKPTALGGNTDRISARLSLWRILSWTVWIGTVVAGASLFCSIASLVLRVSGNQSAVLPYIVLAGVVGSIGGFIIISTGVLRADSIAWTDLWKSSPPSFDPVPVASNESKDKTIAPTTPKQVAWETTLAATGTESRIGDAISSVLELERGSPLAAIVILTDGRSNAGTDPMSVVAEATIQGVPIHTVGLGSSKNPLNVRVLDVEAPKRVFPGDRFRLTTLIQASGMKDRDVPVQLRRRSGGDANAGMAIEEERTIKLGDDDNISSLTFDILPREVGTWVYEIKVLPPAQDSNATDNAFESEVRVVEPKSTVLIVAGGPTREYQFVRNLLYRDVTVQSHVYLQSGSAGVSQEAKKLLTAFPKTRAELSEYDAIIGFDVDWMALDADQIDAMEKWVSEQSGGLVLIAGPVSTPKWAGSQGNGSHKAEVLRSLSPVIMNSRGARLVSIGRFESDTAWKLDIPSDAWSTDFIQVASNLKDSQHVWEQFRGVYSFFSCHEPKPAASIVAYFSDPTAVVNSAKPIYLATQFYGSGRVAFQGGGEFWRLRDIGEKYFDTYYTKLVRWAGQGRLLRDSDRGVLLLDKEQAVVGDQVMARAVLRDAQFHPLILPEANAKLIDPSRRPTPLVLQPIPDPSQPGVYVGQFVVKRTGTYEVQLPVGTITDQTILSQQTVVRVPALEIQRPQRNDSLLSELATRTGGKYWMGTDSLFRPASSSSGDGSTLIQSIEPRDQTNYLPGSPDREFQQRLMALLMALIAGCLCLEWLIRRLSKLA